MSSSSDVDSKESSLNSLNQSCATPKTEALKVRRKDGPNTRLKTRRCNAFTLSLWPRPSLPFNIVPLAHKLRTQCHKQGQWAKTPVKLTVLWSLMVSEMADRCGLIDRREDGWIKVSSRLFKNWHDYFVKWISVRGARQYFLWAIRKFTHGGNVHFVLISELVHLSDPRNLLELCSLLLSAIPRDTLNDLRCRGRASRCLLHWLMSGVGALLDMDYILYTLRLMFLTYAFHEFS